MELQTKRLKLRQWLESDFDFFSNYFADEECTQFLGGTKTKEEAWRLMASYIGHYHLKGYSYLAIEDKTSEKCIGSVGLWNSPSWPELELGYWLLKNKQGNGYATEAATRLKAFAFETLKVKTLVSYISPKNEASKRMAIRLGAVQEKDIELLNFGIHEVYRYA